MASRTSASNWVAQAVEDLITILARGHESTEAENGEMLGEIGGFDPDFFEDLANRVFRYPEASR